MNISVYDNYSEAERDFDFFPIDGEYKTTDSLLAIVCLRGTATFRVRLHDFNLKRGNSLIIGPDAPFYILDSSKDFRIDVVRVGNKLLDKASEDFLKINLDRLIYDRPLNILSERKTIMLHIIHSYMKTLSKEHDNKYKEMIMFEYVKIFFLECYHIMEEAIMTSKMVKRDREITNQFFRSAEKNFMTHRRVEFYATEQGITPKHLALVLKKTTGRHPSDWLEDYVILEAKKLLRNSYESIQAISYDLNFSTPSHFGKFFKDRTGMTPKQFRNMH